MLAQWSDGSYAPFTGGTVNPLPMIEQGVGGNNIRQNGTLKASAPSNTSRCSGSPSK